VRHTVDTVSGGTLDHHVSSDDVISCPASAATCTRQHVTHTYDLYTLRSHCRNLSQPTATSSLVLQQNIIYWQFIY